MLFIKRLRLLVQYYGEKMERFNQFSTLKNDFENQNFDIFNWGVHNFGKFNDDFT